MPLMRNLKVGFVGEADLEIPGKRDVGLCSGQLFAGVSLFLNKRLV